MANVKLSEKELELVTDASFILTKNQIIAKVYELFGSLSTFYMDEIQKLHLPKEIKSIAPKIARGENYRGLPWVMLDYPRYFTTNDVFAIRTYFWWGHFCSITLHLKGRCIQELKINDLKLLDENNWHLCCNTNEWQHHFRADNYQPLSSFKQTAIEGLPFIKLAKKIPLCEWDGVEDFLKEGYNEIISALPSLGSFLK